MYLCSNRFRHASHLNSEPGRNFVFLYGMDYTKQALDVTQIFSQLKGRGLLFKDEARAAEVLANVSYFRLANFF